MNNIYSDIGFRLAACENEEKRGNSVWRFRLNPNEMASDEFRKTSSIAVDGNALRRAAKISEDTNEFVRKIAYGLISHPYSDRAYANNGVMELGWRAVPVLCDMLEETRIPRLRRQILIALRKMNSVADVLEAVTSSLFDYDRPTRLEAATCILELDKTRCDEALYLVTLLASQEGVEVGRHQGLGDVVKNILEKLDILQLKQTPQRIAIDAIREADYYCLGKMEDPWRQVDMNLPRHCTPADERCFFDLIATFAENSSKIWKRVEDWLVALGHKSVEPLSRAWYEMPVDCIRSNIISTLERIPEPKVVPFWVNRLRETELRKFDKRRATKALLCIDGPEAEDAVAFLGLQ